MAMHSFHFFKNVGFVYTYSSIESNFIVKPCLFKIQDLREILTKQYGLFCNIS